MKKLFLSLFLTMSCAAIISAQGTLQFNAAKIITYADGIQTVPSGKVWKVMSVFGSSSVTTACAALPAFCVNSSWPTSSVGAVKGKGYKVNGTVVWQSVDLTEAQIYYQNSNCTGSTTTIASQPGCAGYINNTFPNQTFDELASTLPFWLPAGATLETLGSTANISVLEFNIIP